MEILNTVTLTEQRGVTTVTLVAQVLQAAPEAAADLGGMHEGWRQSFERLESHVATSASEREMIVSRLLNAPRELVFDAWTDPDAPRRVVGPGRLHHHHPTHGSAARRRVDPRHARA